MLFNIITKEIKLAYNAVLVQISQELETVQQEELRFLCDGLIPKTTTKALTIFRALEHAGRISWEDVCFLKESLNLVKRLDLVERLTAFEIKRNLTLLLGLYGRKRKKSEASSRFSSSVEKISEYLVKLPTETMKDRIDCNCIRSLMESRKGIKEVLVKFEDEIERELSFAWSKLTLLVVIAGEMISEALTNDGSRQKLDVKELYSSAAYELCSRMIKLGSWVSLRWTLS